MMERLSKAVYVGGIGVSLQFNDTKIAFVTAHLAAGAFFKVISGRIPSR